MAYNFNDIKKIVRQDGTEITKITNSSTGKIIWQKTYTWEQYNVIQTGSHWSDTKTTATLKRGGLHPKTGHIYKTLAFNSEDGTYSLSSPSSEIYVDGNEQISSGFYDVWDLLYDVGLPPPAKLSYSSGYKYYKYQGVYYELRENITLSNFKTGVSVYAHQASLKYTYEKGSYITQVTSTSASAYPNDGVKNNYWYVRID